MIQSLRIAPSVCIPTCHRPSVDISMSMYISMSIRPSVRPSVYISMSIRPFIHPSLPGVLAGRDPDDEAAGSERNRLSARGIPPSGTYGYVVITVLRQSGFNLIVLVLRGIPVWNTPFRNLRVYAAADRLRKEKEGKGGKRKEKEGKGGALGRK